MFPIYCWRWNRDLCMKRAFLVRQDFWQMSHWYPSVSRCLASTWYTRRCLPVASYPHTVQVKVPGLFWTTQASACNRTASIWPRGIQRLSYISREQVPFICEFLTCERITRSWLDTVCRTHHRCGSPLLCVWPRYGWGHGAFERLCIDRPGIRTPREKLCPSIAAAPPVSLGSRC